MPQTLIKLNVPLDLVCTCGAPLGFDTGDHRPFPKTTGNNVITVFPCRVCFPEKKIDLFDGKTPVLHLDRAIKEGK